MTMQNTAFISEKHLPACLKRKLVFGDREQLNALRDLEAETKKQEEETAKRLSGELKKFSVEVEFTGYATVEVWAADKKEAQEIAKEMDIDCDDLQVGGYYATEIKPCAL